MYSATVNNKHTPTTNARTAARSFNRRTALGLLLAIALGAAALAALNPDYLARVGQERELIAAGKRISSAIGAYYESSPGTAKTYPSSLQHLLQDPRMLGVKKYLEYVPTDPMTMKAGWGEIKNARGEVIGVHSLATGEPTWVGQLLAPGGSGSGSYAGWKFVHRSK